MFGTAPTMIADPSDDYLQVMIRVGDQFPYGVPFGFTEHRNATFTVRQRVFYCPQCEQGLKRAFAK